MFLYEKLNRREAKKMNSKCTVLYLRTRDNRWCLFVLISYFNICLHPTTDMRQYKPWVLSAPGDLGFHVDLEDPATQTHVHVLFVPSHLCLQFCPCRKLRPGHEPWPGLLFFPLEKIYRRREREKRDAKSVNSFWHWGCLFNSDVSLVGVVFKHCEYPGYNVCKHLCLCFLIMPLWVEDSLSECVKRI